MDGALADMSGFVYGAESIEFKEDAEYTLSLAYGKIGEPHWDDPEWDTYDRSVKTFRNAELAWEEYRMHAEMVGHSSLVCASLRLNGELIAMKAVKGA